LRESAGLQETLDFRVKSVQAWSRRTFRSIDARMLKRKPLFLNGLPAGDAATWEEVAVIVSAILGRPVSVREVQANGSEGRESFLVTLAK
jgi:hypothetical protein